MQADSDARSDLSATDRRLVLAALFTGVFVFGMSFGGILPWVALALEERGTSSTMIGIVSAANPIGVMVMAPFVGGIMQRMGAANAIILGTLVAAVTIILMPLFDSTAAWIVLRFLSGLAGAVPWVATETWINVAADGRSRGRVVGLYTAFLSGGFAVGPLVLSVVGVQGWWPAIIFFVLEVAAI